MGYKRLLKLSFINSKVLRRFIRIAVAVFAFYIFLLACLSIYLYNSQERLLSLLNAQIKKTILGDLKINKADITIWQTFPKVGLTLKNVSISDSLYHSPFLKADAITAKVGLFDLMGNKVTISSVKVKNAVIHIFTDSNGYSNTYVLQPKTPQQKKQQQEETKNKKPFVLENLELINMSILIEDLRNYKRFQGKISDADIDMSLTGSSYFITFREDLFLRGLAFNARQGYWLENQRLQAKWKLQFDTGSHVLTIGKTAVKIQGHVFDIDGKFDFSKSIFQLDASTKQINYASATSLLKPKTRTVLQKINLAKPVDVSVNLQGSLSKKGDPSVKVNFVIKQNTLSTPVIGLNNCNFSGSFTNQYNPTILPDDSNSRVAINTLTGDWGTINLRAKNIAVINLRQPVMQFEFFSQCNFTQLNQTLASSVLNFTDGTAKLYLSYTGPLIADPSLLDQLNAKIQIQNGKVVYIPRNLTFSECNGVIDFIGNNLTVKNLQCNLNTNHFEVNINGTNLNRISSKEPGKATLNCTVFIPSLNLVDFTSLFNANTVSSTHKSNGMAGVANAIDNALENGDVYVNLKAQQLLLHNFKANNATAVLLFTNNDWGIQKAFLQFADGSFNLSAKVHQLGNVAHQVNSQIELQHINVKKLFYGFDNFSMKGLTSKNISGVFNSKTNIVMNVDNMGKLVPLSMNGKMYFSLQNAALKNYQPFLDIQKIVFKNRNLDNVQFAELKDTFDIQNGDVYIHRMPVQSSVLTMYIEGIYSFKDNTDISIQVPLSNLKNNSDKDFKDVDRKKKGGASIYLRAKNNNGQVKIGVDVFRKFRKSKF